jgi:hypothetical protein
LKRIGDELVNAYNYLQFLYVYGLLKYKHITTTKIGRTLNCLSLLTNPKIMELNHSKESLKIYVNESEIVSKKRSEKEKI